MEAVEASYGSGKVRLVMSSPVPDAALRSAVEPLGYRLKRPEEASREDLPFGFRWAAVSGALYALAWTLHVMGLGAFVFALAVSFFLPALGDRLSTRMFLFLALALFASFPTLANLSNWMGFPWRFAVTNTLDKCIGYAFVALTFFLLGIGIPL